MSALGISAFFYMHEIYSGVVVLHRHMVKWMKGRYISLRYMSILLYVKVIQYSDVP